MPRAHSVCLAFALCLIPTLLLAQPVPFVNVPLVPDTVTPGSPQFTLTVNGTGFVPASVVNWNGTALATSYISSSKLSAIVPASNVAAATTALITVSSSNGANSAIVPFTVTKPTSGIAFSSSTVPVGLNPATVLMADFNHDGIADLAVANQSQPDSVCYGQPDGGLGTISILLSRGDGTFVKKSRLCAPNLSDMQYADLTPPMVVGDFNNDGNTDVLITYSQPPGTFGVIFLGNGDGTFTQGLSISDPCCADYLLASIAFDGNADGNLDLAIPYTDGDAGFDNVGIFLGNGDGTFSPPSRLGTTCQTPPCLPSSSVAAGDFNSDGVLDLAATFGLRDLYTTPQPVSIFLGNGDGTFTVSAPPSIPWTSPSFITAGDFDGDGILDLVVADAGSTALNVLHGNGDGTFTQITGEPSLPQAPNFVTTADMNGDGKLDLIFLSSGNIISIYLGNGDGTFRAGLIQAVDFAPYGVAVGDFNGDGRLDLAVTNGSGGTVSILLQKPFAPGVVVSLASLQNPANIGQAVTFNAISWAAPVTPTGSVTFKQGTSVLGTAPLVNGQASVTTSFPALGSFPIVASYSGDPNYHAKSSSAVRQIIGKLSTTSGFSVNAIQGNYVVNLASQVGNGGSVVPSGTVTFKNGSLSLGTVPLVNGTATLPNVHLSPEVANFRAFYNGDASNQQSASLIYSWNVYVGSTTTISSFQNPSHQGSPLNFKAIVTSPAGVPSGTVTFTAGTQTLATVTLAGGKATLVTSALSVGTTTVTATYNGNDSISGSADSVVQTIH